MIYLLDTHTFLWILREPFRLPRKIREYAMNPDLKLAISLVTPWEMAIKSALGKLEVGSLLDNFEALVTQSGYILLETTPHQVIHSGHHPFHHRDPFDRLLAAQALELDAPLLSRDAVFDLYGVKRIWE